MFSIFLYFIEMYLASTFGKPIDLFDIILGDILIIALSANSIGHRLSWPKGKFKVEIHYELCTTNRDIRIKASKYYDDCQPMRLCI